MWRLLKAGRFRWVWAGESVSMLGDHVHEIALAWLVLTMGGTPLTLGAILAAGAVPRSVLLLIGGATTDRLSARTLMLASNLVRAVLVAVLVVLVMGGWVRLWQLVIIEVAFGVADAFFYPASGAIVPDLVDREAVPAANALFGTSEQVTMLAGPAAGGVLVAVAGTAGAFIVNAVSFVVAAAGLLPVRTTARSSGQAVGLLSEVRRGLDYAWSDRQLRVVLLLVSAAALTYNGVFAVGLPGLARHRFPEGSIALGVMLGASGAGQLLGVIAAGLTGLPRRWGLLITGMAVIEGVGFALIGVVSAYWAAALVLALLGFGAAYTSDVALPSWIQRRSSAEMLGRVWSLIELPRRSLAPVSFLAFGALAGYGLGIAFACAGVVMLVTAAVAAGSRSVRELTC